MCGRYRNKMSYDQMRRLAADAKLFTPPAHQAPNMQPNVDIRPTTQQWVLKPGDPEAETVEAVRMRWGLVPFFFKGPTLKDFKLTTINAKAETVATAPSYRGAFERRRCLIPADGWYEWTPAPEPKGRQQRHLFTAKDGEPMTFAGIWDRWVPKDGGDPLESFSIVTQPAGSELNHIHDRAPVVIWREDRKRWMTVGGEVADLIRAQDARVFVVRPISEEEIAAEQAA